MTAEHSSAVLTLAGGGADPAAPRPARAWASTRSARRPTGAATGLTEASAGGGPRRRRDRRATDRSLRPPAPFDQNSSARNDCRERSTSPADWRAASAAQDRRWIFWRV